MTTVREILKAKLEMTYASKIQAGFLTHLISKLDQTSMPIDGSDCEKLEKFKARDKNGESCFGF